MQNFLTILSLLLVLAFTYSHKVNTYKVDVSESRITWLAKKVTGEHTGSIQIKNGKLLIKNGELMGGECVIDMSSITNSDIDNPKMNTKLINHLKSDDFFDVKEYPTARLKINNIGKKTKNSYHIQADITIKGKTNSVEFDVILKNTTRKIEATAKITIDRAKYNVRYNSGSFFENLGDKLIYDKFELDVKLIATKL